MSQAIPEHIKSALDYGAVSAVIAVIAGWLPSIAALFTIVWYGIRIMETKTVREWLEKRRQRD